MVRPRFQRSCHGAKIKVGGRESVEEDGREGGGVVERGHRAVQ